MLYYISPQSKSHAFILESRFRAEGILCELTYMPRELMASPCNIGIRFNEQYLGNAINILRMSGLPGCKIYQETITPFENVYTEIKH